MNDAAMAELFAAIELAWPRNWPHGWQVVWVPHVEDLPVEHAIAALRRLIRTEEFPPSVAKLRRATASEMGLMPPVDGAQIAIRWANEWVDRSDRHLDGPSTPPDGVQAALKAYGGPLAVAGDPEGWTVFWGAWAARESREVLEGDLSSQASLTA